MAIRPLNSSLIFDRRVILGLVAAVVLAFTFAFLYSPDLRPSTDWMPPLSTKPTSPFTPPLKNNEDPYVVELDYLAIRPNVTEKVRSYWNIPYAADAGGKNRFRGPQPVNRTYGIGIGEKPLVWDGALGMCPRIQKIDPNLRNRKDISGPEVLGIKARSTEDCLSLNVFTPFDAEPGDDLPVLVNIPGGGFHLPGRSNGGEMVEKARREKGVNGKLDKGIVVVTMYYRNGIYGFLSGEQIAKDGNYNNGLRDQRAALEWVQKYIRYFGGNPDHVVIMGTSAGGASVMLQLTANQGDNYYPVPGTGRKQLFHGAIAQSPASPTFFTTEQAEKFYNEVASGLNCTDIACVRNAATGDLYYENYPMNFPGRNTPPRWMWAPTTEPAGGIGKWWDAVAKAQGDIRYICPTYLASNAMAEHKPPTVPTYQYQWDVMWGVDIENGFGTKHAGTVGQVMVRRQNEISDYFISFIKFLDPNVEHETIPRKDVKIAKWEPLDASGRRMFFTNIKEGGHRGDGTDMLGPMRTEMRTRDAERERKCGIIRGMFRRLQFDGVEAVKVG
ncbi:PnbA, Carboxylesterase type B [Pyrenophora tritici-repentis]|uniref:Carboxylic ester hydrolase n=1 Tax=Pyrenophora tritici-repentis TaxID=45151 RepID=A0A317AHY6_9PLEO|nr:PnbA, Carboxylesterase type B [Pyrenophora tritici-repentis]